MATHWAATQGDMNEVTVTLAEQIKTLRAERGWSQADLAERVGGDAGQISRYEHGRVAPSVVTVVRLAEAFGVSADSLLIDGSPRRSHRAPSEPIADRLSQLDALGEADRDAVLRILDGLLANTRIRQALNPAS